MTAEPPPAWGTSGSWPPADVAEPPPSRPTPHGPAHAASTDAYLTAPIDVDQLDAERMAAEQVEAGRVDLVAPAGAAPPMPGPAAAAPAHEPAPAYAAPASRETVSCPECGAVQDVLLNRRDATDFCHACDFPLFWTPSRVQRERDSLGDGQSLRRLPGAVGRSTLASAKCPHCAELNLVSAVNCIRCGQPMHPVYVPPPPVYVAPPPPPPAPVEVVVARGVPWWVWVLLGFVVTVLVVLGVLFGTGTIG